MATKKTKTTKKKKELTTEQKIGVGVGLTAAAVAAAGAYFLYGSEKAAKNRKAVKSWALKAKAEILEKLEDAKEMTAQEYEELIPHD
jgi:peptidyl-tRNA hydrolase